MVGMQTLLKNLESSLFDAESARKDLYKQRAELDKQIKLIEKHQKNKHLANDVLTTENIDAIIDCYESKQYKKLANLCLKVYNAVARDIYDVTLDPEPGILDFIQNGRSGQWPNEFGLNDIDIQSANNIVVGAKSGHGKTSFGVCLVYDWIKHSEPCIFFSVEMTVEQLWMKLLQVFIYRNFDQSFGFLSLRAALTRDKVLLERCKAFINFAKKYLVIVDASSMTAHQMIDVEEYIVRQTGKIPRWRVVDYIQIVEGKYPTPRERLMAVSQAFAERSKETNTNTFLLSQLNDAGDFRESQKINDDAGMSIVIERDRINDAFEPHADIVIKKSRFTPLKRVRVEYDNPTGTIGSNIEKGDKK